MNKPRYLAHHGIIGQKWGVRRYQNEDGSLTAEGEERYGVDDHNPSKQKVDELNVEKQNLSSENSSFNPKTATKQQVADRFIQLYDSGDDIIEHPNDFQTGLTISDYYRHPIATRKLNKATNIGLEAMRRVAPDRLDAVDEITSAIVDKNFRNRNFNWNYWKYKLLQQWFFFGPKMRERSDSNLYGLRPPDGSGRVAMMIQRGVKAKDIDDLITASKKYQISVNDSDYKDMFKKDKYKYYIFELTQYSDSDDLIKFAYECEKIKNKEGNKK